MYETEVRGYKFFKQFCLRKTENNNFSFSVLCNSDVIVLGNKISCINNKFVHYNAPMKIANIFPKTL